MASVTVHSLDSACLAERRAITVFLPTGYRRKSRHPVLYLADGQAVHGFADRLGHAIDKQGVTPVVLIGVHSSERYRVEEYIAGVDDRRFAAHEHFFADEVYRWATAEFGLPVARNSCGVFGVSNGAAFALTMGVRHREKYGIVVAFSIAGGPDRVDETEYAVRPVARYYLSAGTREKPFLRTGRAVAEKLKQHGVDFICTERCAGHEFSFWDCELPEAIRWSFPPQRKGWMAWLGRVLPQTS